MVEYRFGDSSEFLPPFEEGTPGLTALHRPDIWHVCLRALQSHFARLWQEDVPTGELPIHPNSWHMLADLHHQHIVPPGAVVHEDQAGGAPTIIYKLAPAFTVVPNTLQPAADALRAYWLSKGCRPTVRYARRIRPAILIGVVAADVPPSKLIIHKGEGGWITIVGGDYLIREEGFPGLVRVLDRPHMYAEFSALMDGQATHTTFL